MRDGFDEHRLSSWKERDACDAGDRVGSHRRTLTKDQPLLRIAPHAIRRSHRPLRAVIPLGARRDPLRTRFPYQNACVDGALTWESEVEHGQLAIEVGVHRSSGDLIAEARVASRRNRPDLDCLRHAHRQVVDPAAPRVKLTRREAGPDHSVSGDRVTGGCEQPHTQRCGSLRSGSRQKKWQVELGEVRNERWQRERSAAAADRIEDADRLPVAERARHARTGVAASLIGEDGSQTPHRHDGAAYRNVAAAIVRCGGIVAHDGSGDRHQLTGARSSGHIENQRLLHHGVGTEIEVDACALPGDRELRGEDGNEAGGNVAELEAAVGPRHPVDEAIALRRDTDVRAGHDALRRIERIEGVRSLDEDAHGGQAGKGALLNHQVLHDGLAGDADLRGGVGEIAARIADREGQRSDGKIADRVRAVASRQRAVILGVDRARDGQRGVRYGSAVAVRCASRR